MTIRLLTCLMTLTLLAACENYDYTFNERVIYSPRELFSDFEVADEGLERCLTQTISDAGITAVGQLTDLNCSHAGIADLDGLALFTGLVRLSLSSNAVRNLVELGSLDALEELHLDGNRVVDPVPLYGLPSLRFVDLSGNPDLQCPQDSSLLRADTVVLPQHCR